jgi:rod shape determining protein RodA
MVAVFEKPSLWQRASPMLKGFDGPLAFAVFLLACAGLLIMYSSGYDHGTRFMDHGRNMLIAGGIMFVVAQIPPQRLMAFAVPLYTIGVALLIAVAIFGITKKGARRWLNVGVTIQPSEILKIAMPLMLAWWFQKREGQLRPLDFAVAGLLLALPVGLIMKQPDLGTSLLVMAAGLSVIFFAGLSWKLVLPPMLLGLVGNLALIAAFIFLILRALAIAVEAPTLFARLMAAAVAMIFFSYAFVNMGMVSGILPVVGVPLPFISYGGTAMVTLGLALGILMSISKAKRLVQS